MLFYFIFGRSKERAMVDQAINDSEAKVQLEMLEEGPLDLLGQDVSPQDRSMNKSGFLNDSINMKDLSLQLSKMDFKAKN